MVSLIMTLILYSSVVNLATLCAIHNAYTVLVRKPKEKRPFGTTRCRWEDSLKMDLKRLDLRVWIEFNWFRTSCVLFKHSIEPSDSVKVGNFLAS
jgi:hypothetical protein